MSKFFRFILFAVIFFITLAVAAGAFFAFGYGEFLQAKAALETKEISDPRNSIVINFSQSMLEKDFGQLINITPNEKVNYDWESSGKKLVIKPEKIWKPNTEYRVSLNNARSIFFIPLSVDFSFKVADYPRVVSFYPENGSEDVVIDIEDPIKINFNKPLRDYGIKFKVFPPIDLAYEVSDDQREIKLLARDGFKKGEKYEFDVYVKHKNETDYQEIYFTFFKTFPPPITEWEKDFTLRLAQAKKYTPPKIKEGKYIDINLKNQVMVIFENGLALESFLISSGKRGMDTPQGSFQIYNKHPRPWSKRYGLFMPFWMAIAPDGKFGIHELPEWPGGYKEGVNHLGIPVSHGCVRLGVGSAEKVYNWAEIGTPVIVHI